jgi:hypothetical protein
MRRQWNDPVAVADQLKKVSLTEEKTPSTKEQSVLQNRPSLDWQQVALLGYPESLMEEGMSDLMRRVTDAQRLVVERGSLPNPDIEEMMKDVVYYNTMSRLKTGTQEVDQLRRSQMSLIGQVESLLVNILSPKSGDVPVSTTESSPSTLSLEDTGRGYKTLDQRNVLNPDPHYRQVTKLLSDAAMLRENQMLPKEAGETQANIKHLADIHNPIPKLITNQTVILPSTRSEWSEQHNLARSLALNLESILASQNPSRVMNTLNSESQNITEARPMPRSETSEQSSFQSSRDWSTPSTLSYTTDKPPSQLPLSLPDVKSGMVDKASRALNSAIMSGVTEFAMTGDVGSAARKAAVSGLTKIVSDDFVNPTLLQPNSAFKKIVADDPPMSVSTLHSSKIVGDDDTALGTKDQFRNAAVAINSSIGSDFLSRLISLDQLLASTINIRPGSSRTEAFGQFRKHFTNGQQLYKVANQYTNENPAGVMMMPIVYPIAISAPATPGVYNWDNFPSLLASSSIIPWSKTMIGPVSESVPLLGNVTWQLLRPLMANVTVAEFSSALRVKVRMTDMDAMANTMAHTYSLVEAMSGYAFSSKLAKLLGYVVSYTSLNGRDESGWAGVGLVKNQILDANGWVGLGKVLFPFNSQFNRALHVEFGLVTYVDFIELLLGRQRANNPIYGPDTWGRTTAVCMVNRAELQNGAVMACRALQELEYPVLASRERTEWWNMDVNNTATRLTASHWSAPVISGAQIEGPTAKVLFVVIDDERTTSATETIQFLAQQVQNVGYPNTATIDTDVFADLFYNFSRGNSYITYLMAEITRWEQIYGNNSDRCSAMRWAAENSKLYRISPKIIVQPANVNNTLANVYSNVASNFLATNYLSVYNQRPPPYTGYVDTFSNQNDLCRAIATQWRTPTYQMRYIARVTFNNPESVGAITYIDQAAATYMLGASFPSIDFLCCRGWLRPSEEYPATRIYDYWQLVNTIYEMADVMAAYTDSVMETHSVNLPELTVPYQSLNFKYANQARLHLERGVWPAIRLLFSTGPQFPSCRLLTPAYQSVLSLNYPKPYYTAYTEFTEELYQNQYFLPATRISFAVRAKYNDWFLVNDPVVALGKFGTHQAWMTDQYTGAVTVLFNMPTVKGDKDRIKELVKISLGAPGTADKNLLLPQWIGVITRNGRYYSSPLTLPGMWYAFAFGYRTYSNETTLATNIAFPAGYIPPSTDVFLGGDKLNFVASGPRDAFVLGSNSTAFYPFVQATNIISMKSAPIANAFDPDEFADADPVSSTLRFL